MCLAGAAELTEATEDETDSFLDPQVGIKAQPNLAVPDVANRNRDPQFASPGLRASCVEHPGA
jgi:hypothetical protein